MAAAYLKSFWDYKCNVTLVYDHSIPIIGVGGIMSADDGVDRIKNGAILIQIYSGLIFKGHHLIYEICKRIK